MPAIFLRIGWPAFKALRYDHTWGKHSGREKPMESEIIVCSEDHIDNQFGQTLLTFLNSWNLLDKSNIATDSLAFLWRFCHSSSTIMRSKAIVKCWIAIWITHFMHCDRLVFGCITVLSTDQILCDRYSDLLQNKASIFTNNHREFINALNIQRILTSITANLIKVQPLCLCNTLVISLRILWQIKQLYSLHPC